MSMNVMTASTVDSDELSLDLERAIVGLYRDHYRTLVRTSCLLLDDQGLAEEVVQEAFVRLYGSWAKIREPQAAAGYLRVTVLNLTRSRMRRLRVARRHAEERPHDVRSAEEQALRREDHEAALTGLRGLPRRQRECLALRYHLDLSDREVAETLGISLGSAKTHIRRGLAAIGERLEGLR